MIRKPGTVYVDGERSRPSRVERLAPGDVVGGHYVVEELLDEGGMAVVYRATNSATGKACALKILHAQLGNKPEFIRLFAKEAKVSSVIGDHVHIVQVYDAGLDNERGIPFIVMELLDGETLERLLEQGPLAPALIQQLLVQLQSALDQAHVAGVVHRDLKPSNIFIATDSAGEPLLKVMDFGIAKVMEGEALRTATQVGTPAYNAPEQMGSTTRKLAAKQGITIASGVSPQTDIWALGLMTYEMFTGDLPGRYWGVETLSELPMKVAFEEHESASERAGQNAALLPDGFDAWFARCLHKNAVQRWPSAREAIDVLMTLMEETTINVSEEEMETVSTRLFAPKKKAAAAARSSAGRGAMPKSVREAASDPPPLPRISSPAISEASVKAAQQAKANKSKAIEASDDKEMSSSDGPMIKDNDETPAPPLREPKRGGFGISPAATFAVVLVAVGGAVAYGISTGAGRPNPTAAATSQPAEKPAQAAAGACGDDGASEAGCKAACEAGSLQSCQRLGGMLVGGKGAAKDAPAALAALSKACGVEVVAADKRRAWTSAVEDSGCPEGKCVPQACVDAAGIYELGGADVIKDERAATSLYKRVCRVGQKADGPLRGSAGCVGLGEQRVRAGETAAARGYFEAACEDGLSSGCVALASVLERGDDKGEARDEKRARTLYQKACDGGDLEGCTRLGRMVERGRGGWVRDQAAAVALYKRSCEGGLLLGCVHLADAHLKGKGKLTRDAVRAVELLQNSCDGGEQRACADLALMVRDGIGGLTKDSKRAFMLNQKACTDGAPRACKQLGEMYIDGAAGLTKDPVEGRSLIERACRAGDALGCVALAGIDADKLTPDERQQLLERACEGGEPMACSDLGELVEHGVAGEADAARAAKLYQQACDDGAMRACTNLANLTYQGLGGLERDAKRSVELNDMSCAGGDMVGCTRLGVLYALGQGIDADKKKAAELHAKACKGELNEDMQARCEMLEKMLARGEDSDGKKP